MVYGELSPPPKIKKFMDDAGKCSRIANDFQIWEELGLILMREAPHHCKNNGFDPNAMINVINYFLTTAEVIRDQARLDRSTITPTPI